MCVCGGGVSVCREGGGSSEYQSGMVAPVVNIKICDPIWYTIHAYYTCISACPCTHQLGGGRSV